MASRRGAPAGAAVTVAASRAATRARVRVAAVTPDRAAVSWPTAVATASRAAATSSGVAPVGSAIVQESVEATVPDTGCEATNVVRTTATRRVAGASLPALDAPPAVAPGRTPRSSAPAATIAARPPTAIVPTSSRRRRPGRVTARATATPSSRPGANSHASRAARTVGSNLSNPSGILPASLSDVGSGQVGMPCARTHAAWASSDSIVYVARGGLPPAEGPSSPSRSGLQSAWMVAVMSGLMSVDHSGLPSASRIGSATSAPCARRQEAKAGNATNGSLLTPEGAAPDAVAGGADPPSPGNAVGRAFAAGLHAAVAAATVRTKIRIRAVRTGSEGMWISSRLGPDRGRAHVSS